MALSLQDRYAPENRCFGCGPANELDWRIKSRPEGDEVVADFQPEPQHQALTASQRRHHRHAADARQLDPRTRLTSRGRTHRRAP
jgi:hypothetical protein